MVTCCDFAIGKNQPLFIIAGPCVVEDPALTFDIAAKLKEITQDLHVNFVFKASVDKANRSSIDSFRGIGYEAGLNVLADIKKTLDIPVLTDIHTPDTVAEVASVVDILQIPAFLCRQTDLVVKAAETNLPVNIKKGQFLAPWDMEQVINKLCEKDLDINSNQIWITERGTSFGYNTLVVDFRSLPQLKNFGCPVIFDATHSVQQPGGQGETSGGQREFVEHLARAAVAVGVAGVFIETHQDPDNAPSDGPNMVPLNKLENLLKQLNDIDNLIKS